MCDEHGQFGEFLDFVSIELLLSMRLLYLPTFLTKTEEHNAFDGFISDNEVNANPSPLKMLSFTLPAIELYHIHQILSQRPMRSMWMYLVCCDGDVL